MIDESAPGLGRRARHVLCVLIAVWLIIPLFTIIPISFSGLKSFAFPPKQWTLDNYRNLSDPIWWDALKHSITIAIVVSLIATTLGTLASFGLVRSRSRWMGAVRLLILSPQVVPIVIVGLGIYLVFLRWRLVGTMSGFVIAHTVMALPLVVVPVTASLETFDRNLERAAASLGARPLAAFWQVTLPSIRPAVLTAALLSFLASFDEFVLAFFVQSPSYSTLPVVLYRRMSDTIDPSVAAVASIQLTLVVIGVAISLIRQRRIERADQARAARGAIA
jgi:putative spermidine/putrescine transport system permease protein